MKTGLTGPSANRALLHRSRITDSLSVYVSRGFRSWFWLRFRSDSRRRHLDFAPPVRSLVSAGRDAPHERRVGGRHIQYRRPVSHRRLCSIPGRSHYLGLPPLLRRRRTRAQPHIASPCVSIRDVSVMIEPPPMPASPGPRGSAQRLGNISRRGFLIVVNIDINQRVFYLLAFTNLTVFGLSSAAALTRSTSGESDVPAFLHPFNRLTHTEPGVWFFP
jgi:hypothetical protein